MSPLHMRPCRKGTGEKAKRAQGEREETCEVSDVVMKRPLRKGMRRGEKREEREEKRNRECVYMDVTSYGKGEGEEGERRGQRPLFSSFSSFSSFFFSSDSFVHISVCWPRRAPLLQPISRFKSVCVSPRASVALCVRLELQRAARPFLLYCLCRSLGRHHLPPLTPLVQSHRHTQSERAVALRGRPAQTLCNTGRIDRRSLSQPFSGASGLLLLRFCRRPPPPRPALLSAAASGLLPRPGHP